MKTRVAFLTFTACILFSLQACAQSAVSKGALSFYQLKGPVKSVEFLVSNGLDVGNLYIGDSDALGYRAITSITFDRNGRVASEWKKAYQYDEEGRLKEVYWDDIVEDDFAVHYTASYYVAGSFTYDSKGNLLYFEQGGYFPGTERNVVYKYNEQGDVIEYNDGEYTIKYQVIVKDKYGNWLVRKTSGGKTERRELSYYE